MTRKAPLVSWLLKENGLSKATTFFCTFREKLFAKKPRLVSRAHTPPRAEGGPASAEGEVRCSSIAMGRKRCSHGKLKDSCVDCKGCPHGKLKRNCADCNALPARQGETRAAWTARGCPHSKLKRKCADVQPLPAWQAEKQLRGLQLLPAWQAETRLRGLQPLPA
jgi:hypothetical protein